MPATTFDLRHPEVVEHELAEANRRLAREPETPPSIVGLVEDVAAAIADAGDNELAAINPWLWIAIQRAALHAQAALHDDEPARRRRLRLALEQLRFLFARLAERRPVGEDQPADAIVRWLDDALAGVSQQRKAALLGVGLRTYQRWVSGHGRAAPTGDDDRRLRIVARLVNQLRHSLTGAGVADWFDHPRADLGRRRPVDLLDDADLLEDLLAAAAASRGNVAA